MAAIRRVSVILGSVLAAAMVSSSAAWAGGPAGVVEDTDMSRAVGSGLIEGALTGFSASGPTNAAAVEAVVAACQNAGAEQCSSDEVTNDVFCVVSVGADDGSGIVSGGAGETVEAARADAFRHVGQADLVLDPGARVLASSCP